MTDKKPTEQTLELVDDLGTVKVDELTTINTERTGPAIEEPLPEDVVMASMSERDLQLRNRPGMRSPTEVEKMKESGSLPQNAAREGLSTIDTKAATANAPASDETASNN